MFFNLNLFLLFDYKELFSIASGKALTVLVVSPPQGQK